MNLDQETIILGKLKKAICLASWRNEGDIALLIQESLRLMLEPGEEDTTEDFSEVDMSSETIIKPDWSP